MRVGIKRGSSTNSSRTRSSSYIDLIVRLGPGPALGTAGSPVLLCELNPYKGTMPRSLKLGPKFREAQCPVCLHMEEGAL